MYIYSWIVYMYIIIFIFLDCVPICLFMCIHIYASFSTPVLSPLDIP